MDVVHAQGWGWFGRCVALLQSGQPLDLRVNGWHAKRFARAVALGENYHPSFFSSWLMPRLEGILAVAGQSRYRVTPYPTDAKGVLSFVFTKQDSSGPQLQQ